MRQAIHAAGPVLLAALLLVFGNGLLGTLTSLRLASESSTLIAGIATSAYFAGQMAGAIYGQRTLRAVGHIRAFAAFAVIGAAAATLQPLLEVGWTWALLRFVYGVAVVVMFLAMESWLNASVANEARGSVFSVYMTSVYCGLAVGQAPVAMLDLGAATGFSIASICVMLAAVPMCLTARAQPALDNDRPLSVWRIFTGSPAGAVAAVACGAFTGCLLGLGPIYAQAIGLSDTGVATFMACFLLSGLIASWPLGKLSDRVDRRSVILVAVFAIAGAGGAGALVDQQNLTLAYSLAAIFGFFSLPIYSIAVAHANDVMAGESPVATASGMIVAFGAGALAAPLVVAWLMATFSAAALPASMAGIAAATVIVLLARIAAKPTMPAEDKIAHQSLPRTTALAYALDPWAAASADDEPGTADAMSTTMPMDEADEHGWRDAWFTAEVGEAKDDTKPE